MRIQKPSFEILDRRRMTIAQKIEAAGRLAYKSEDKITDTSAGPFFDKMVSSKHFPVIEFANVHLKITVTDVDSKASTEMLENFLIDFISAKYLQLSGIQIPDLGDDTMVFLLSGTVRALSDRLLHLSSQPVLGTVTKALMSALHTHKEFPLSMEIPSFEAPMVTCEVISAKDVLALPFEQERAKRHLMAAVKFIVNRAVTHELVRHRPCSFLQESQRYCRYSEDKFSNEVTFIDPSVFFGEDVNAFKMWQDACEFSEKQYFALLNRGCSPQAARTVLPNSCKTEIIVYCPIEEWEHIFALRTPSAAEPSMREVMIPLEEVFFSPENMLLWE